MSNISIILRKVKAFIKSDSKTKFDFLYAYFYTGVFRMYILFVPFNRYTIMGGLSTMRIIQAKKKMYLISNILFSHSF